MNLFAYEISQLPENEELLTILQQNDKVRIERVISTGQSSDWYDQEETEFVALLQGSAQLLYADGSTLELSAGDTVLLLPHVRHRVARTSAEPPCIWLCFFY